jgi:hypothetical protein
MQPRVMLACLGLLLGVSGFAQNTTSSATSQPAATPQLQSQSGTNTVVPKDSDKEVQKESGKQGDSDRGDKWHVRLGTISIGAGYSSSPFFFGPFWPYGFYPYSFAYAPFFYDPFYSPFYRPYAGGFGYGPDKGEVKLTANPKDAQVFLDGAYAGTANHLRSMWLTSGAYDLSVSVPGREPFQQRIYVLSGKSLKIDAKLATEKNLNSQTEAKP